MAARTKSPLLILSNGESLLIAAVYAELWAAGLTTGQHYGASMVVKAFAASRATVWSNKLRKAQQDALKMLSAERTAAVKGRRSFDFAGASSGIWLALKAFRLVHARLNNILSRRALELAQSNPAYRLNKGAVPGKLLSKLQKERLCGASKDERAGIHFALRVVAAYESKAT